METVLGEPELFALFQHVFLPFVPDDSFPVQSKDQCIPGGCMLAQARAGIKGHDHEFHLFVVHHVHIHDFPVLVGYQVRQFEYLACFDDFVHDILLLDFDFHIHRIGFRRHAHRYIRGGQDAFAGRQDSPCRGSGQFEGAFLHQNQFMIGKDFGADVRIRPQGEHPDGVLSFMDFLRNGATGHRPVGRRNRKNFASFKFHSIHLLSVSGIIVR